MLLETIHLNISPDIFDVHFSDFINETWKDAVLVQHKVGNVRLRYEVYFQVKNTSKHEILIAEIERTKVYEKQIEVRVAIIDINSAYSRKFINSFYNLVFNKWSANFAEFENGSGGLLSVFDAALKRLLQSWGFDDAKYLKSPRLEKPSIKPKQRITLEEKLSIPVNDPGLEAKRQTVLAELQKRLPSIEKLPGYTSKSKKKTTGRPGLSEEELFNRLSKAQEAVEKKAKDPKKSWRDIAMEIDWNWGKTPESEVKLLEEARKYLERFSYSDPDGIMKKFEKWKKTKKT